MNNLETTLNTLTQLNEYIHKENWTDIQANEYEDSRYSIAIDKAVSAINRLDQYIWERDVAIDQLKELGLSLGENTDHIKDRINKQTATEPVDESDFCIICPNCGAIAFKKDELADWIPNGYCFRCGQLIKFKVER